MGLLLWNNHVCTVSSILTWELTSGKSFVRIVVFRNGNCIQERLHTDIGLYAHGDEDARMVGSIGTDMGIFSECVTYVCKYCIYNIIHY